MIFAMLSRGQSVGWQVEFAVRAQKDETAAVPADRAPPDDLIERMQSYPSTSDEFAVWRMWLARRGVRLPEWKGKVWVFLPAPSPPDNSAA